MKRSALIVGLAVFIGQVVCELILLSTIPGHFKTWYALPDRHFIFAARLLVAAIVAIGAGLLVDYARRKAELIRRTEELQKQQEAFLNHHVRNALSALQYAAYLTRDKTVVEQCDAAIARIVWALSNAKKADEIDDSHGEWLKGMKTNLGPSTHPTASPGSE